MRLQGLPGSLNDHLQLHHLSVPFDYVRRELVPDREDKSARITQASEKVRSEMASGIMHV
jgi:hypothetical protein